MNCFSSPFDLEKGSAWDSNPGLQDGRGRQIHLGRADPQRRLVSQ